MNTQAIPATERREMVRRLIALCHLGNELVDMAEDGSAAADAATLARQLRTGLRDAVVDLVANGHAGQHPEPVLYRIIGHTAFFIHIPSGERSFTLK